MGVSCWRHESRARAGGKGGHALLATTRQACQPTARRVSLLGLHTNVTHGRPAMYRSSPQSGMGPMGRGVDASTAVKRSCARVSVSRVRARMQSGSLRGCAGAQPAQRSTALLPAHHPQPTALSATQPHLQCVVGVEHGVDEQRQQQEQEGREQAQARTAPAAPRHQRCVVACA